MAERSSVSDATVKRTIGSLVEKGVMIRIGAKRGREGGREGVRGNSSILFKYEGLCRGL